MDSDKSVTANFSAATTTDGGEAGKKGCFIATAAYGSLLHPYVKTLREFRDKYLMPSRVGRKFIELYYKYSPFAANFIAEHKLLKIFVRTNLLPLVVFSYSLLHLGPIIIVIMFIFVSVVPIVLVSFSRRKMKCLCFFL
jgi:hypothetical protein